MSEARTRVSYPKELKEEMKKAASGSLGLYTVSISFPSGDRDEHQGTADLATLRFLRWALVLAGRPDLRPLPNLEDLVRRVIEKNPQLDV